MLHFPRLQRLMRLSTEEISNYVGFLLSVAELVEVDESLSVPIDDPDDVVVLQTALAGKAEVLCTLDKDFYEQEVLAFSAEHGFRIMTDVELLRLLLASKRSG